MNQNFNQSTNFAAPNTRIPKMQRRATGIGGIPHQESSENRSFFTPMRTPDISKPKPQSFFNNGNRSMLAPFGAKRSINDIGQQSQSFFTPHKSDIYADEPNRDINADDLSTTKPGFMDHHNKTVQRNGMFQSFSKSESRNLFNQSFLKKKVVNQQISPNFGELPKDIESHLELISRTNFHDRVKSIISTQDILEVLANDNANVKTNDLSNQFASQMAPEYELEPLSFQASEQSYIPKEIIERGIEQMGQLVDNIQYFIVQNCLYLWRSSDQNHLGMAQSSRHSFSHFQKYEFNLPIQKVCYVENHFARFTPFLIIATKEELKLMEFKPLDNSSVICKLNYNLIQVKDSDYKPIILDFDEEITCIVQHQKTGRIFYSSHCESYTNVKIKEINIGNMSEGLVNNLMESISNMAITTFGLNIGLNNKRLKAVSTDDQSQNIASKMIKSVAPSIMNFFNSKKLVKEIKFDEQRNVMYVLYNFVKTSKSQGLLIGPSLIEVYDMGSLGDQYSKVSTISQKSFVRNLLDYQGLVLEQDKIKDQPEYKIISIQPLSSCESIERHLLVITQGGLRVYISFDEVKREGRLIKDHENLNLQFDYLEASKLSKRFKIQSVHSMPLENDVNDIYQKNPFPLGIINLSRSKPLSKNEHCIYSGSPVYSNDMSSLIYSVSEGNDLNICFISKNESAFCHYREAIKTNHADFQNMKESFAMVEFEKCNANEEVKTVNVSPLRAFSELSGEIDLNTQRMIGYNKPLKLDQGWGLSNQLTYMTLSQIERQVYESHQVINVLTNYRSLNLVQIRPIDLLVMILKVSTNDSQEIEDFAYKFPISEVCNLLIQILSEGSSATYVHSQKIEQCLVKSKLLRRNMHQPLQSSFLGRDPNASKSNRFGLRNIEHHLEYGLYPYFYSMNHQDEIDRNISIIRIDDDRILHKARDLLLSYGDCIRDYYKFTDHSQLILDSEMFTLRYQSIYTYLQRLIRPIWDMNITYRQNHDKYQEQISNMNMFLPVFSKLQNLLETLEKHQLYKQGDLSKIPHNDSLEYRNQLSVQIRDKLEVIEKKANTNLIIFIRRCMDVITFLKMVSFDGQTLKFKSMMNYLYKQHLGKHRERHQRNMDLLIEISNTRFKDFVLQGGGNTQDGLEEISFSFDASASVNKTAGSMKNRLIKKLFEISTLFSLKKEKQSQENKIEAIKDKALHFKVCCPTLFTNEQTRKFIGESIIDQALGEKDVTKQNEMITQGIDQLIERPHLIDLEYVVPKMCETNNYLRIIELSMLKIKKLEEFEGTDEKVMQCQDIVMGMFTALNKSINSQKDWKILDNTIFQQPPQKSANKQQAWHNKFFNYFEKLKGSDDYQKKIQLRRNIIVKVENFADKKMLKSLFLIMINFPGDHLMIQDLPHLDIETFDQVCRDIIFIEKKITKSSLDAVFKLMLDDKKYGSNMRKRVCELAMKLCTENDLVIIKSIQSPDQAQQLSEVIYLTCEEKLMYCQVALDNLTDSNIERDTKLHLRTNLERQIELLRYQSKVIQEIQSKIDQGADHLKEHKDHLNTLNLSKEKINEAFVNELNLYDIMYENINEQMQNAYDNSNFNGQLIQIFERQLAELGDFKIPFENILKYSTDVQLHELAISRIVDFAIVKFLNLLDGKHAPDHLASNLIELNNQLISNNEVFSYLGDLYMSTAQGKIAFGGCNLHRLIQTHRLKTQNNESRMFIECSKLVSIYLWTNKYVVKIAKNQSFRQDLRDNLQSIREILQREKNNPQNEFYPKVLINAKSEFIQKIEDQMSDQEFNQMLN